MNQTTDSSAHIINQTIVTKSFLRVCRYYFGNTTIFCKYCNCNYTFKNIISCCLHHIILLLILQQICCVAFATKCLARNNSSSVNPGQFSDQFSDPKGNFLLQIHPFSMFHTSLQLRGKQPFKRHPDISRGSVPPGLSPICPQQERNQQLKQQYLFFPAATKNHTSVLLIPGNHICHHFTTTLFSISLKTSQTIMLYYMFIRVAKVKDVL